MIERILLVDDDDICLSLWSHQLGKQFAIETARDGIEGLEAVSTRGPYAVVVADMYMPGMDGIQLLAKVHELAPDTIRIMVTGNADQQLPIDAVNEGHIFSFLTKPCSGDALGEAIAGGVSQYRLAVTEKEHLETLRGCIRLLTEIVSLVSPIAFSQASRLQHIVGQIATQLKLPDPWQFELAALLSQIGCLVLPPEVLEAASAGERLSDEDQRLIVSVPEVGRRLLSHIPRLELIADIIAHECESARNDHTTASPRTDDRVRVGAQILRVARGFNELVSRGMSSRKAIAELLKRPQVYDPAAVSALHNLELCNPEIEVRVVRINELAPRMVLDEDVRAGNGVLLVKKDQEVTVPLLERLWNYGRNGALPEKCRVRILRPNPDVSGQHVPRKVAMRDIHFDPLARPRGTRQQPISANRDSPSAVAAASR